MCRCFAQKTDYWIARCCFPGICSSFGFWLQPAAVQVVDQATASLAAIHFQAKASALEMMSPQSEIGVDPQKQLFWQQGVVHLGRVSR